LLLKYFLLDETGQGMTEYALIIAMVALVVFISIRETGGQILLLLNRVVESFESANP